jgi:hypothetical protein
MRSFIVFVALFSCSVTLADDFTPMISRPRSMDEVDRNKFYDYKERLKERRIYALETRRQLNAGKVHRYWTAIRVYPDYYYRYNYYPNYNYSRVERYRLEEIYNNSYYGY